MAENMIGQGSYGMVYAQSPFYVVKVIPFDQFDSAVREIVMLRNCNHPNVVGMGKVIFNHVDTHIVLHRYQRDLRSVMSPDVYMPIPIIVSVARDIILALNHIHSAGIIHGDIKPANILVNFSQGIRNVHAAICDFGISAPVDEVRHCSSAQTVTYRAPEVNMSRDTCKFTMLIDMWGLGCILFELITGESAYMYDGTEDPTIYACRLLNLDEGGRRRDRVFRLRGVQLGHVREIIHRRTMAGKVSCITDINYKKYRYDVMFDMGFIDLVAMCLLPDCNKRVSSKLATEIICRITGVVPRIYVCGASNYISLNHSLVKCGLPKRTLFDNIRAARLLSRNCLKYARGLYIGVSETLYCYTTVVKKCVTLYIAACVYRGSPDIENELTKIIPRDVLFSAVADYLSS